MTLIQLIHLHFYSSKILNQITLYSKKQTTTKKTRDYNDVNDDEDDISRLPHVIIYLNHISHAKYAKMFDY